MQVPAENMKCVHYILFSYFTDFDTSYSETVRKTILTAHRRKVLRTKFYQKSFLHRKIVTAKIISLDNLNLSVLASLEARPVRDIGSDGVKYFQDTTVSDPGDSELLRYLWKGLFQRAPSMVDVG